MPIVRYTTPTIKFEYSDVNVTDIVAAYLVIVQGGKSVVERDLATATVVHETVGQTTANYISWTLEQVETKRLSKTQATIYCDWKLRDGTRGRSNVKTEAVEDSGKSEVI